MKIPTTPQVARFNQAVQVADELLGFRGDSFPVRYLVQSLMAKNHYNPHAGRIAVELREAAAALDGGGK